MKVRILHGVETTDRGKYKVGRWGLMERGAPGEAESLGPGFRRKGKP